MILRRAALRSWNLQGGATVNAVFGQLDFEAALRELGVDVRRGDVWIYGNVPCLQQPFGDVEPIPVLPAPSVQLGGEDIRLFRQSQVPDL
jgi:hypothetical protein